MTLYKLTDENGETYNHTKWGPGVTHTATGKGPLCGPGWIYAYTHPLLAVLLNPAHANFKHPRLWEAEGIVGIEDKGLKVGCKSLTTTKEIDLPKITAKQTVKFAIFCALEACVDPRFVSWAKDWLDGKNRSSLDATTAYAAAYDTAYASVAAYDVAYSAAASVYDAAYAAYSASAASAAFAAVHAVHATNTLDLASLAEKAAQEEL